MGSPARRQAFVFVIAGLATPASSVALDRVVSDTTGFSAAIAAAVPGDTISLQPGVYGGGHFRAGLTDVVIRKAPGAAGEAILRGGVNGIQLSDAVDVTIEGLTFEQQTGNGLNIDDGGTFATPSTNLTLRDLTVRDMAATGNNDGIKLSGVTGFHIDGVRVFNWGARGSAIDPVGSHHGLIENSHFFSDTLTDNGSGVRPKGGSKSIVVRGNLMELPTGAGRAFQAGGATGSQFFRFIDGDSGYEADDITFVGNRVVGGASAMNWVNIDGGVFRYNDVRQPTRWAMRVLNENSGLPIVDTRGGVFSDNAIEFSGDTWSRAVNVGAETDAASYTFARNRWLNVDDPTPAGSTPSPPLPAPETDPQYGVAAPFAADEPMRWSFGWGEWIVPLDAEGETLAIADAAELLLATAGEGAGFDPLQPDPLTGEWSFEPAQAALTTAAFEPVVLVRPESCALCAADAGDYDRDGAVDEGDFALWQSQYGETGAALADGNGDGVVDAADYTVWRDASGETGVAVPEPAAIAIVAVAGLFAWRLRRE